MIFNCSCFYDSRAQVGSFEFFYFFEFFEIFERRAAVRLDRRRECIIYWLLARRPNPKASWSWRLLASKLSWTERFIRTFTRSFLRVRSCVLEFSQIFFDVQWLFNDFVLLLSDFGRLLSDFRVIFCDFWVTLECLRVMWSRDRCLRGSKWLRSERPVSSKWCFLDDVDNFRESSKLGTQRNPTETSRELDPGRAESLSIYSGIEGISSSI